MRSSQSGWRYRHSVLAICCVVYLFYHASRQMLPPTLPLLKDELGLNYAQAGFLAATYDIGYGLTLIAAGFVAARVKKNRLIVACSAVLSISLLLTAEASGFLAVAASRILGGASFGVYFVAGVSLVSSHFSAEDKGKVIGIHEGMGGGSGRLIAPLLAGILIASLGWRPLFYIIGLPLLPIALLFWRTVREPEMGETQRTLSVHSEFRKVFGSRFLSMLGICNAFVIATSATLYSFLPVYLVNETGSDLSHGGWAVAVLSALGIPIIPVLGALSDRYGRRAVISVLCGFGAGVLFLFPLLAHAGYLWLAIVAAGLCVGTAFPVMITYATEGVPFHLRSIALGYTNTFSVIGGSVATVVSGYISDAMGINFVFPFLSVLSIVAALLILTVRKPKVVEAVY